MFSPSPVEVDVPAIGELGAHILQICVAHVVDAEYEQMLVFLDAFPDVGVQPSRLFLVGLFGGLGLVDDAGTLGTRHGVWRGVLRVSKGTVGRKGGGLKIEDDI